MCASINNLPDRINVKYKKRPPALVILLIAKTLKLKQEMLLEQNNQADPKTSKPGEYKFRLLRFVKLNRTK